MKRRNSETETQPLSTLPSVLSLGAPKHLCGHGRRASNLAAPWAREWLVLGVAVPQRGSWRIATEGQLLAGTVSQALPEAEWWAGWLS